jgi:hypothetical protein
MRATILVLVAFVMMACGGASPAESDPTVNVDVSSDAGPEAGGTKTEYYCGSCMNACTFAYGPHGQYCQTTDSCGRQCNCCAYYTPADVCINIYGANYCCAPNTTACGTAGPNLSQAQCGTVPDGCGGYISCGTCGFAQYCSNHRCKIVGT